MKKLSRIFVCMAMLALLLCTSAMAADANIAVQLNGESLSLTDAAPQIVNDRTYLPFRAVFTALGFADEDITYQSETKTVSAVKDDLTISMVIGENKVTVTEDGQTTVLDTDAAAFIDPILGRTYVPARFASEAAGCRVGWNDETRTVIIDDVDAILADNQETYQLLDQYLDYARQFQTGNHQIQGAYSAAIQLSEGAMDLKGDYSMLTADGTTFDFQTLMQFSGQIDGEDLAAALPDGVDFQMRGDLSDGVFYFQSNSLMTLMELGVQNLWIKADLGKLIDMTAQQTGMSSYADLTAISQLAAQDLNGKDCIALLVDTAAQSDSTKSARDYLTLFNSILGDSAFTKQGSSYLSKSSLDGAELSLTLTTSSGKVNGYSVTMNGGAEMGDLSMEITMADAKMTAKVALSVPDTMSMQLDMDGQYAASIEAPTGAPEKGAAVVDLLNMIPVDG